MSLSPSSPTSAQGKLFSLFLLAQSCFYLVIREDPFFGDAISGVIRASLHMYEQGLATVFFRPEHDPGHPTLFPYLLAVCWVLLGKKLWVAHLLVNLFAAGVLYRTFCLARLFLQGWWVLLPLLFLSLCATYLSQSAMVTNHMPLCFFYLLALEALYKRRTWLFMLASSFMLLLHLQALFMLVALGAADWLICSRQRGQAAGAYLREKWLYFIPAMLVFVLWGYIHYRHSGWAYSSPVFAEHRETSGLSAFIRHLLIACWRFVDYGYILLYLPLLLFIIKVPAAFKKLLQDKLLLLFLVNLFITAVLIALFLNYSPGHRYFLPFTPLLCLSAASLIHSLYGRQGKPLFLIVLISVGLFIGNYIYYPGKCIGDGSLAYRNYFAIAAQIRQELSDSIPLYTYAPLAAGAAYSSLGQLPELNTLELYGKQLEQVPQVLQSNCNCEFSEAELTELKTWKGKSYEQHAVYVNVLFNPAFYQAAPLQGELRKASALEQWMEERKKKNK